MFESTLNGYQAKKGITMRGLLWTATTAITAVLIGPALMAQESFTYDNPAEWDGQCQSQYYQSPVQLDSADAIKNTDFLRDNRSYAFIPDSPLPLNYTPFGLWLKNDGHTMEIGANLQQIGNAHLTQIHFHRPAEHSLSGRAAMEMHVVHKNAAGSPTHTVVAVMLSVGEVDNPGMAKILQHMDSVGVGESKAIATAEGRVQIDPNEFYDFGTPSGYYMYSGSFTTPPCYPTVRWFVLSRHGTVSVTQVEKWKKKFPHENARPLQPWNSLRYITKCCKSSP